MVAIIVLEFQANLNASLDNKNYNPKKATPIVPPFSKSQINLLSFSYNLKICA